jgi:hypothetical protein
MASSNKRMMSSTVAIRRPFPDWVSFLVARLLAPTDLATFAICAHQIHEELRGFLFPLDLMLDRGYYTQERLSTLVIQPGFWKLTTVRIIERLYLHRTLPVPPPALRKVMLYNYTCLDILERLTLLEDLTIQRHAHDQRPNLFSGSGHLD